MALAAWAPASHRTTRAKPMPLGSLPASPPATGPTRPALNAQRLKEEAGRLGKLGRDWMIQWCPHCQKLVSARLETRRDLGILVSDRSTCVECSLVLWDWTKPTHFIPLKVTRVQLSLFDE